MKNSNSLTIILITTLFFFFPIISIPCLIIFFLFEKNIKRKKYYAILIAIIISIVMYYFVPDISKDLYRYYIIMRRFANMPFNVFLAYITNSTEPLSNLYFYMISKTGNNNLIMIITTLISYGLIYAVLFNHQEKTKLSNFDFNIVFIFMLSVFYLVDDITGIRFCLARLILFWTLYQDLFKGKKNMTILLLYPISILIHTSCIIFVFARILMFLSKNKFNIKIFFLLLMLILSPQIIISMSSYLSNISFLSSLSIKANEYLHLNAGFYPMFILQVIIAILLYITLIYSKEKGLSNKVYINYILIILSFGLLMITKTSISTRFIRAGIIFSLPVIMDYIKSLKNKSKIAFCLIVFIICDASLLFQYSHLTYLITYDKLFETGIFRNIVSLLLK